MKSAKLFTAERGAGSRDQEGARANGNGGWGEGFQVWGREVS